jgi:hypothetical protein
MYKINYHRNNLKMVGFDKGRIINIYFLKVKPDPLESSPMRNEFFEGPIGFKDQALPYELCIPVIITIK